MRKFAMTFFGLAMTPPLPPFWKLHCVFFSPKWMFFWKTPKRPFGNYIALFFAKVCKYALTCVNLQWNFLDWRWPPPSPPFWTFFPKFTTKIYRFETKKICNVIFWIGNDPPPPPFGSFPKKHPFLGQRSPLNEEIQFCGFKNTFSLCW